MLTQMSPYKLFISRDTQSTLSLPILISIVASTTAWFDHFSLLIFKLLPEENAAKMLACQDCAEVPAVSTTESWSKHGCANMALHLRATETFARAYFDLCSLHHAVPDKVACSCALNLVFETDI